MASPSTPPDSSHGGIEESKGGYFRKAVCLYDWWLIKTDKEFQGKRLGIAGLTSTEENEAIREFSSAAIAKRFDVFTLETSDDVVIVIQGFINKQKTTDNGFPSQVFKNFVFGFPPDWEKHAEEYTTGEDTTTVSQRENLPSTIQCSLEAAPTKNGHVIHEDRKEVEVSEDPFHKVSKSIPIHSSQISNLSSKHANEKRHKISVTPIGYRRCRERLRNLKGNQENPASAVNVIPITLDEGKLNSSLSGTILTGKSSVHLSAKIRGNKEEKRVIACGLMSQNSKLNPFSVVSHTENNPLQNELGGRNIPISSGNERQELVHANVVKKLGDGFVKDGPQQSSKSKRGQKPKNVNTKAAKETDVKEESTPRKKTRRKIIYEKQVPLPSPEKQAKTLAVPPGCSAYGRSRSGRLLLPAMEFWRNQIPVYDSQRNITGLQGELPVRASARGSRSEPPKKRNR